MRDESKFKRCCGCGDEKAATPDNWYFYKGRPKGRCKICKVEQNKNYALQNPMYTKRRRKEYYASNRASLREKQAEYYAKNKVRICSLKKLQRAEKPGRSAQLQRARRRRNPQLFAEYDRKRVSSIEGRMNRAAMSAICTSLAKKGLRKTKPRTLLVGWNVEELIQHMEPLFDVGMSWGNYGEWHIDHIVPLSVVNFQSQDDPRFKEVWALNNLAPLWAKDNIEKSANVHWQLPDAYKNQRLRKLYDNRDITLFVFG